MGEISTGDSNSGGLGSVVEVALFYRQEVESGQRGFNFNCLPRLLGITGCRLVDLIN